MMKVIDAPIDMEELAVRIAEACLGLKRPAGVSAATVLRGFESDIPGGQDMVAGFRRAALAAVNYVAERITAGGNMASVEGTGHVH